MSMCGILAVVYRDSKRGDVEKLIDNFQALLARRGHDHVRKVHYKPIPDSDWSMGVLGCVLHMRGTLSSQPIENSSGDWLLWNGEIFKCSSFKIDDTENDGEQLLKALSSHQAAQDVLGVFNSVQGPWAMIYFQASPTCLWFGRDVLGRRSLVWYFPAEYTDMFIVSSVGYIDSALFPQVGAADWSEVPSCGIYRFPLAKQLNFEIDCILCYTWTQTGTNEAFTFPHDAFPMVTMEKSPQLIVPFQKLNCSFEHVTSSTFLEDNCVQLLELLQEAVRIRIDTWKGSENIGILFSGGLDSVILAALVDRCLDIKKEVDLINVAFSQDQDSDFNVPDRVAAIQALGELSCKRKWNLVMYLAKVNVSHDELEKGRYEHIHQLIYPLDSVMDDSIGCALWFAARSKGLLYGSGQIYESKSKILLVGMGADEQFGGYARHRTAFEKGGWQKVLDEVAKDLQRISVRNLGRDDRCISDHHKEARYPYLDESVIDFTSSLPIWMKTDYHHPRGLGEKILLRKGASVLGCEKTARMPKRAIQFGSKIANICGSTGSRHSGMKPMIKENKLI